jgi:acetylornithine deacetylase/succinyl-diaminopimelate desuccinylase family protein
MNENSLRSLLQDLVRINSVNAFYANGPGEAEIANFVEALFVREGFRVERQLAIPATEESDARENILVHLPGRDSSRRLVLEAHMDTVSVSGMTIDPFDPRFEEGCIYGRGSVDTKAGLAGMMAVLLELKQRREPSPCDVVLAAVVDEEYSFRGVSRFVEHFHANGAIVSEPTELKIVVASKGVMRWRVIARGKVAHSAKKHLGINAIHHMAQAVLAFEEYHAQLNATFHPLLGSPSGNVGMIRGGVQVNFVPDECMIEIDRRLLPTESPDLVLARYQSILDELTQRDSSMHIEMEPPYIIDPAMETSPRSAIVSAAVRAASEVGIETQLAGVPYGSDASKLARNNIPAIIFGPGSIDQAHTACEYVEWEQVFKAFEFYRAIVRHFEG